MRPLVLILLLVPLAGYAGDVKIRVKVAVTLSFPPRYVPSVSPHHITAASVARAKDSCVWVAGVRHCPRAEPR